jgi:hypothetical protein
MDTSHDLRPAGRLPGGGTRFYAFAPDGRGFRIYEEIRTRARKASRPTAYLLATFDDAEDFVRAVNMAAVRS